MDLSRTVSEIDCDFSRKSQNFSNPLYVAYPLKGLPLVLGIGALIHKTRILGLPGQKKKFDDIFSRLDTIHQRDGQTDRQPDTGRQQ